MYNYIIDVFGGFFLLLLRSIVRWSLSINHTMIEHIRCHICSLFTNRISYQQSERWPQKQRWIWMNHCMEFYLNREDFLNWDKKLCLCSCWEGLSRFVHPIIIDFERSIFVCDCSFDIDEDINGVEDSSGWSFVEYKGEQVHWLDAGPGTPCERINERENVA